ncbi:MAG: leucyl aminopeptidase, partial [Rhodospirillales bacterium]|nr:leucyl aminopeptidase [Rhodospirillales bacterium]
MKVSFAKPTIPGKGAYVVAVLENRKLTPSAVQLDKKMKGVLKRAIRGSRFKGSKGQSLSVLAPVGTRLDRVFLIGLGKPEDIDDLRMQDAGGLIFATLASVGVTEVSVAVDEIKGCGMSAPEMAAELAFGAKLRSYNFDKYRTKQKKEEKPSLKSMTVLCNQVAEAKRAFSPKDWIANGVFFTRDLVSEPANVIYPETLAEQAKTLSDLGIKVEVFGQTHLEKLGMGALLGVAQGSVREPKVVVMQWNGAPKKAASGVGKSGKNTGPIAFIGKGVTFDTGGISIKPSANMEDMKWDMGGSGVVIGLMKALAGRKA